MRGGDFVDRGRKKKQVHRATESSEVGGPEREGDEAGKIMWMLMLMLRQSKLPSGPGYMLGSY